jgi:hypothetical protein
LESGGIKTAFRCESEAALRRECMASSQSCGEGEAAARGRPMLDSCEAIARIRAPAEEIEAFVDLNSVASTASVRALVTASASLVRYATVARVEVPRVRWITLAPRLIELVEVVPPVATRDSSPDRSQIGGASGTNPTCAAILAP